MKDQQETTEDQNSDTEERCSSKIEYSSATRNEIQDNDRSDNNDETNQTFPSGDTGSGICSRLHPRVQNKNDIKLNFGILKKLVPCTRTTHKVSHEEILHGAIDYIKSLQESLEARVRRNITSPAGRTPLASISVIPQESISTIESHIIPEISHRTENPQDIMHSSPVASGSSSLSEIISSIQNPVPHQSSGSQIRGRQKDDIVKNIIGKVNEYFIEHTSMEEEKDFIRPPPSASNLITSPIEGKAFNVTPKDPPLTGHENEGSASSKRKRDLDSEDSIDFLNARKNTKLSDRNS